jgi:hypothetical protein
MVVKRGVVENDVAESIWGGWMMVEIYSVFLELKSTTSVML